MPSQGLAAASGSDREISCEEAFAKVRKTLQALGANKLQTPSAPRQTHMQFSITFAKEVLCFMLNTSETLPLLFVLDHRWHTVAAPTLSQPQLNGFLLVQEREKHSHKGF